jgi:DNA-binding SARP family transcriptional activator
MENDIEREIQSLKTAANLYEDDLLPGVYDDWLAPVRDDYRRRLAGALHRLATLYETQHLYAEAIPWAERLVALDSLSETYHQLLIRLHAANHDRASAVRAYHRCMRVLRREMGVEPGPATRELFERILKAERDNSSEFESETSDSSATKAAAPLRPLIGRANEWQQLKSAWHAVAAGSV